MVLTMRMLLLHLLPSPRPYSLHFLSPQLQHKGGCLWLPSQKRQAAFGGLLTFVVFLLGLGMLQMQALWTWGRQQMQQKHVHYPPRMNRIMAYVW